MKLTAYKLTDAHDRTYGDMQWGPGVTHMASGNGELCGPGWIHVYSDPLLAVALNPIHAGFAEPHLWRCAVGGAGKPDRGLKSGYTEVTTVQRMELPAIPTAALVRWAITLALQVYSDAAFEQWGQAWLSGNDRSERAAEAALTAARAAAWARSAPAASAEAAAEAEKAAAWAAAWAAWAASAAAQASARASARAAAQAAEAAAQAAKLPLADLLRQAIAETKRHSPRG